jgi:hypothetical protein
MPVVATVRGINDMSLDDLMIAITLGGLLLSGTYIRACIRELRRERNHHNSAQRSGVDGYHR